MAVDSAPLMEEDEMIFMVLEARWSRDSWEQQSRERTRQDIRFLIDRCRRLELRVQALEQEKKAAVDADRDGVRDDD